jgi:hypothetical protein
VVSGQVEALPHSIAPVVIGVVAGLGRRALKGLGCLTLWVLVVAVADFSGASDWVRDLVVRQ